LFVSLLNVVRSVSTFRRSLNLHSCKLRWGLEQKMQSEGKTDASENKAVTPLHRAVLIIGEKNAGAGKRVRTIHISMRKRLHTLWINIMKSAWSYENQESILVNVCFMGSTFCVWFFAEGWLGNNEAVSCGG
jgi:hypothetical protein